MPYSTSEPNVISLHIVKYAALAVLSSAVQLAIDLLFLVTLTVLLVVLPVLFSPMAIEGPGSTNHDTPIREFQLLSKSPDVVAYPSSPPALGLLELVCEERGNVEPMGESNGNGEEMEKGNVDYLGPQLLSVSRWDTCDAEQPAAGLEDEGDIFCGEGRGTPEEQSPVADGKYRPVEQGSATDGQVAFEEEDSATNREDTGREQGSSAEREGVLIEHDQNSMEPRGYLTLLSSSQEEEERVVCEAEDGLH